MLVIPHETDNFLTIDNNNLNNNSDPKIKSDMGQHSHCDVFLLGFSDWFWWLNKAKYFEAI